MKSVNQVAAFILRFKELYKDLLIVGSLIQKLFPSKDLTNLLKKLERSLIFDAINLAKFNQKSKQEYPLMLFVCFFY